MPTWPAGGDGVRLLPAQANPGAQAQGPCACSFDLPSFCRASHLEPTDACQAVSRHRKKKGKPRGQGCLREAEKSPSSVASARGAPALESTSLVQGCGADRKGWSPGSNRLLQASWGHRNLPQPLHLPPLSYSHSWLLNTPSTQKPSLDTGCCRMPELEGTSGTNWLVPPLIAQESKTHWAQDFLLMGAQPQAQTRSLVPGSRVTGHRHGNQCIPFHQHPNPVHHLENL